MQTEQKFPECSEPKPKKKKKINLYFILFLCIIIFVAVSAILNYSGILTYENTLTTLNLKPKPATSSDFSVHFIDVGQGDCELIISNGKTVLIDGGDVKTADKVVSYIRSQNIKRLDYIIVTHPHSDHIGGLSEVIDSFEVGEIFMTMPSEKLIPMTLCYEKLLNSVKAKGLSISSPEFSQKIAICDSQLTLYPPQNAYDELNNYSIVSRLTYKNVSFLFSGDAQKDEEQDLIGSGADLSADVLKVGHHGSNTSSTEQFLKLVKPQICIISCGAGNSFGLPDSEAVDRLNGYTHNIFRTDLFGTIIITFNCGKLEYKFEKGW